MSRSNSKYAQPLPGPPAGSTGARRLHQADARGRLDHGEGRRGDERGRAHHRPVRRARGAAAPGATLPARSRPEAAPQQRERHRGPQQPRPPRPRAAHPTDRRPALHHRDADRQGAAADRWHLPPPRGEGRRRDERAGRRRAGCARAAVPAARAGSGARAGRRTSRADRRTSCERRTPSCEWRWISRAWRPISHAWRRISRERGGPWARRRVSRERRGIAHGWYGSAERTARDEAGTVPRVSSILKGDGDEPAHHEIRLARTLGEGGGGGHQRRPEELRLLQRVRGRVQGQALRENRRRQEHRVRHRGHPRRGRFGLACRGSRRVRAGDGRRGGGSPAQARRSRRGARRHQGLDRALRDAGRQADGAGARAARAHDALARRRRVPVPRRSPERHPAPDAGRPRHHRALGRHLSDHGDAPVLKEETEMATDTTLETGSIEPNRHGYRTFTLGSFNFERDEYFAHVVWPKGRHMLPADAFLRALQRDIAWGFFYGIVNFDAVIGTVNHYGTVDLYAGRFNAPYRKAGLDHSENFKTSLIQRVFEAILEDWTNATFDPFASPAETGSAFGPKNGSNKRAITRHRVTAKRMIGCPGDEPPRSDETGFPINRHFVDVGQDAPDVQAEPGFEDEVVSYNLFAYLSRSDVTWNPSVVSVCKASLYCPTTEEYIRPVIHGNDRVEWFVQLSDEIHWEVEDRDTGALRARVVMKAGDVAAMPADIRHRGFSPKRSMLLVWENASPELPQLYASGKMPPAPVIF